MAEHFLRHYTQLPAAIHTLMNRKLTLLDPSQWEDKNDSHFLDLYKKKKELTTLVATCFTQTDETYHHWKIYAGNPSGVCMIFFRDKLLEELKLQDGLRYKEGTVHEAC